MAKKIHWGFDAKDMDKKVRPQDDFFTAMTGGWMKRNEIPADERLWGTFQILAKLNDVRVKGIVESHARKRSKTGSEEQQIGDLFRSGMDMKHRNALGSKPLAPYLDKISQIKNTRELVLFIHELHKMGIGLPWGAFVTADDKNSDKNIIHMYQSGLGMPDREYYLGKKPEHLRVRAAYQKYLVTMFGLLGKGAPAAQNAAKAVLALETKLARASMRIEDVRDPDKSYNKTTYSRLVRLAPGFEWATYFRAIGADKPAYVNVMQPKFLKAVDVLLKKAKLEDWKVYLALRIAAELGSFLSQDFVEANFNFYSRVLSGQTKMKPLWRRTLGMVDSALGEAIGKRYVAKYFPPSAKKLVDEMVDDLFASMREHIRALDWMSPATKQKALAKLAKMVRKIGYPDKWKTYRGLVIKTDDYLGNVLRSSRYEQRRNIKKLRKPVDRSEWHMTPQMVNAYYNPSTNEIAFPAGILQPPYFGAKQDAGINYGAIGGVIGHEITHGFDDQGSKYDGNGNLRSWWTKKDHKRFAKRTQLLRKQFDAYELYGLHVNGQLTLGENIADLGGYAVAFDAYKRHIEKHPTPAILDDFTPEQRFFLGMAQDWKALARPEAEKTLILTNPHSPHIFRVNGPASNLECFYTAWGIKKSDKLYREPKDRAKIW